MARFRRSCSRSWWTRRSSASCRHNGAMDLAYAPAPPGPSQRLPTSAATFGTTAVARALVVKLENYTVPVRHKSLIAEAREVLSVQDDDHAVPGDGTARIRPLAIDLHQTRPAATTTLGRAIAGRRYPYASSTRWVDQVAVFGSELDLSAINSEMHRHQRQSHSGVPLRCGPQNADVGHDSAVERLASIRPTRRFAASPRLDKYYRNGARGGGAKNPRGVP